MNYKTKMYISLIALIGAMYYWTIEKDNGAYHLISLFILVLCAYLVGYYQKATLDDNRIRAKEGGSEQSEFSFNSGGLLGN